MPRQSRIDAPGALHHIICRGIERRPIFEEDADRQDFVRRLGDILSETSTPCYAWALIPNHVHLLLRTGRMPVSTVMRRLLTGYAVSFNRRHQRSGHLFQNRYQSILCQEDAYLLELVRYIHLNPLRARLAADLDALARFPFCGHGRLLGKMKCDWQAVDKVLGMFDSRKTIARRQYAAFVSQGAKEGKKPELTGGGLIRSIGGWQELKAIRRMKVHLKSDERVLGDSDFVASVLKSAAESMEKRYRLKARGITLETLAERAGEIFGVPVAEIMRPGKRPPLVKARSVLAHWAVMELGMTATEVGRKLGLSQSAVSRAVNRGGIIAAEMGLGVEPEEQRNA